MESTIFFHLSFGKSLKKKKEVDDSLDKITWKKKLGNFSIFLDTFVHRILFLFKNISHTRTCRPPTLKKKRGGGAWNFSYTTCGFHLWKMNKLFVVKLSNRLLSI